MAPKKVVLTSAKPEELSRIYRHLNIGFLLKLLVVAARFSFVKQMPVAQVSLSLAVFLVIASLAATIYLCWSVYKAGRLLGFSLPVCIITIIVAFFIPLVLFVMIISADIRLAKALRASGWKMTLISAKPK